LLLAGGNLENTLRNRLKERVPLREQARSTQAGMVAVGKLEVTRHEEFPGEYALAPGTLKVIHAKTQGYPYFVQHLGWALWDALSPGADRITAPVLEAALEV